MRGRDRFGDGLFSFGGESRDDVDIGMFVERRGLEEDWSVFFV